MLLRAVAKCLLNTDVYGAPSPTLGSLKNSVLFLCVPLAVPRSRESTSLCASLLLRWQEAVRSPLGVLSTRLDNPSALSFSSWHTPSCPLISWLPGALMCLDPSARPLILASNQKLLPVSYSQSTAPPSLVSLANVLRVHSAPASRSVIKALNRTGHRTEPRGTLLWSSQFSQACILLCLLYLGYSGIACCWTFKMWFFHLLWTP